MQKIYAVMITSSNKTSFLARVEVVSAYSSDEAVGFILRKYKDIKDEYNFKAVASLVPRDFCKKTYELEDLRIAEEIKDGTLGNSCADDNGRQTSKDKVSQSLGREGSWHC